MSRKEEWESFLTMEQRLGRGQRGGSKGKKSMEAGQSRHSTRQHGDGIKEGRET